MKNERGYALITALSIAILYFGLMELMLIDSMRSLSEAQRFKARVIAVTLAENGAELAGRYMVAVQSSTASEQDSQGDYSGRLSRSGNTFEIIGVGETAGIIRQKATVRLNGRVEGNRVIIDYALHSQ